MGNSASNHHKEVVQGALAFLDYGEACRLPVLFAPPFLPSGLDFWQRACERLADERALALPRACDILEALEVLGCPSWRHLFARLSVQRVMSRFQSDRDALNSVFWKATRPRE